MSPLVEGMAAVCYVEKFAEYLQELEEVPHKIVENLEQD